MDEANVDSYPLRVRELTRFLSRSNHGGYMFAILKYDNLWHNLAKELAAELAGKEVDLKICHLYPGSDTPLVDQISSSMGDPSRANAVLVNGLEADGEKGCTDLLLELNFGRERLIALQTPILFLINEKSFPLVSSNAIDLFSHRAKSIIEFSERPEKGIEWRLQFDLIQRVYDEKTILDEADLWELEYSSLAEEGEDLERKKYLGIHLVQLYSKIRQVERIGRVLDQFPQPRSEVEQAILDFLRLFPRVWNENKKGVLKSLEGLWERLEEMEIPGIGKKDVFLKFWDLVGDACFLLGKKELAGEAYFRSTSGLDMAVKRFGAPEKYLGLVFQNRTSKGMQLAAEFPHQEMDVPDSKWDFALGLTFGVLQEAIINAALTGVMDEKDFSATMMPGYMISTELKGDYQSARKESTGLFQLKVPTKPLISLELLFQVSLVWVEFCLRNSSKEEIIKALRKALEIQQMIPELSYTDYFDNLGEQLKEKLSSMEKSIA